MKGAWITTVILLLGVGSGFCQSRQGSAGICMSGFLTGKADIEVEYAFGSHWSASAGSGVGFTRLYNGKSEIEKIHEDEFGFVEFPTTKADEFYTGCLQCRYWTRESLNGPFISTGLRFGSGTGIDCTIGAGYRMHIWRGLAAGAEYKARILSSITAGRLDPKGIRIWINYTFQIKDRYE